MVNIASVLFGYVRIEIRLVKAKTLRPFAKKIVAMTKNTPN
jgi:ribosomal protein L17